MESAPLRPLEYKQERTTKLCAMSCVYMEILNGNKGLKPKINALLFSLKVKKDQTISKYVWSLTSFNYFLI